jgi:hypothetical protein
VTTTITPEEMYFGAPGTLTVDGVDAGGTTEPPKLSFDITKYQPDFQNAKGPIKGTAVITKVIPKLALLINQISALKLAWALPGATSTGSSNIGVPNAGLDTTLATDPALGAVNIKVAAVAGAAANDFIRIGPAGPTEANSEVVQVTNVGTLGAGGTGLDVVNDQGGGLRLDHANAEEVKEVTGSTIALDVAAGATNVKLASVTGLIVGSWVRFGDFGEYETRQLTAVGTAGAGGTGVTFLAPLLRDHDAGDWAIAVTGAGKTTITWTPGRVPSSSYKNVVMIAEGLDGRTYKVTIQNALSAENVEMEFGNSAMTGLPLVLEGNYDPATPTVVPCVIELA